ncbi:alpha/beta-hydrolase [Hypoxylon trugodes]|uniref:alpha/beta-hydrolase n=1 Tax=Hypoxylon trugodes TaxID=326681 RepID=UPI00218D8EA7|nr:alpha/beta-hydrolase [Hypoxylon trugodes]KAI1392354.1 alpha/beta-hydrolase [Hypoxylon trugodes]
MATTIKPTIVIIHGGWHTPESYEDLVTSLESSGYEVHVPRMPSMNQVRPPNAGLVEDTTLIRDYVSSLVRAGCHVAAIMHSYGGQVGTNALHGLGLEVRSAKGLKGGVSHLIYVTAYAGIEGSRMMDKVEEFGHMHLVPIAFDFADDGTALSRDFKGLVVGPGRDEADTEAYVKTLSRWNGRAMYEPLEHSAWREIPVTYVYTTADMTVPIDYQKAMVGELEKAGVEVRTWEIATGHCPNVTATRDLVETINKTLGG